jgi:hypothetical protein
MEVNDQSHAPAALSQERAPGIHCVGDWVGTGAGVDFWER